MLELLSAEALKLRGHKAFWFLIWLYPLGFVALFITAVMLGTPRGAPEWFDNTASIWSMPRQAVGRYLISAFVAVVFAGEYDWNTWKLIVPHRSRLALIASKYAVTCLFFLVAFALTAIIAILCAWAEDAMTGDPILGGMSAGALLGAHAKGALAAAPSLLLTVAVTSLAAILTRSMLAAMIIGMVMTSFEQIIFTLGPRLSEIIPDLAWNMFHVLPGYHLANLTVWIYGLGPLRVPFPSGVTVALQWQTSLAVVAAWIIAATLATVIAFRRQDIN
jgi:ABC-type transport system involved in multi-copper enzyme maturation permease subunit